MMNKDSRKYEDKEFSYSLPLLLMILAVLIVTTDLIVQRVYAQVELNLGPGQGGNTTNSSSTGINSTQSTLLFHNH